MRLLTWRKSQGLRLREVAERIGTDASTVNKWESGERVPRREQMEIIFSVTGGAVTPCSFYRLDCAVEGACQRHRQAGGAP